jgi:hypothetical protein
MALLELLPDGSPSPCPRLELPDAVLPAQAPGAAELLEGSVIQKIRRHQVAKACLVCKRAKAKCGSERPCARCSRLRIQAACVDVMSRPFSPPAAIERPLEYTGGSHFFAETHAERQRQKLQLLISQNGLEWLNGAIHRAVELGWDAHSIVNLFASLPDDWSALLKSTCRAMSVMEENRARTTRFLASPEVRASFEALSPVFSAIRVF